MIKLKRIFAYVIDMLFLCFLSTLIINSPILNFHTEDVDRYRSAISDKLNNINYDEYFQQDDAYNYLMNYVGREYYDYIKSQGYIFIVYIVLYFLYFVVFAYFNQGRTLGYVFLKLKVVNNKNTKPSMISLFIRSLFIGTSIIFINPLYTAFAIVIPRVLSVNASFLPIFLIFGLSMLVEAVFFITFLVNRNNMSLQDYMAGTKILEYKR